MPRNHHRHQQQQQRHEEEEDPYKVLSLPRDATLSQIKASYRKLALQYHPDRQTSADDKQKCSDIFTRIGNAYEILSDADRRREFDEAQAKKAANPRHDNEGLFSAAFDHNPFFHNFHFGGFGGHHRDHQHSREFTDPFELFDHFFAQHHHEHRPIHGRSRRNRHDPFQDPFFTTNFDDMFTSMMGQRNSHMNLMSSMMGQHDLHHHHHHNQRHDGKIQRAGKHYGTSTSTTTTTRIINGKRETITETSVVRPDGTVERRIQRNGRELLQG